MKQARQTTKRLFQTLEYLLTPHFFDVHLSNNTLLMTALKYNIICCSTHLSKNGLKYGIKNTFEINSNDTNVQERIIQLKDKLDLVSLTTIMKYTHRLLGTIGQLAQLAKFLFRGLCFVLIQKNKPIKFINHWQVRNLKNNVEKCKVSQ